ncbi:hypothetical protein CerSpe_084640 [Prunus speciosa]
MPHEKKAELGIVKNFLLKTLHLQGGAKTIDNFTIGEGVQPASFKVSLSHSKRQLLPLKKAEEALPLTPVPVVIENSADKDVSPAKLSRSPIQEKKLENSQLSVESDSSSGDPQPQVAPVSEESPETKTAEKDSEYLKNEGANSSVNSTLLD